MDAIRDDAHRCRRAETPDQLAVCGVEDHNVAVEPQAEPFDREERKGVTARYFLANETLGES